MNYNIEKFFKDKVLPRLPRYDRGVVMKEAMRFFKDTEVVGSRSGVNVSNLSRYYTVEELFGAYLPIITEMFGDPITRGRFQRNVRGRRILIWALRIEGRATFDSIGKLLARDGEPYNHATMMHHRRKIADFLYSDRDTRIDVKEFLERCAEMKLPYQRMLTFAQEQYPNFKITEELETAEPTDRLLIKLA
jgi:hypothetical protein